MAHTATRRSTVRTTPIGPSRPIASAAAPKTSVHSHWAPKPSSSSESAAAAVAITSSSKIVQPRHWTTLIAVGRNEPRVPSGARISVIAGTRACAPIRPATASIRLPTRQPTTIATSAEGSESAGTRIAPATMTSSEMPEVAPEEAEVEAAEHPQALGDGIDAPRGVVLVHGS